jgi:hypothetical protein
MNLESSEPRMNTIPTNFLPQKNTKNAEITTYIVFSLWSLRSFVANPSLVAAWPRQVHPRFAFPQPAIPA